MRHIYQNDILRCTFIEGAFALWEALEAYSASIDYEPQTQERLAELLPPSPSDPPAKYISYWENDTPNRVIDHRDRALLIGLICTLHKYGGIEQVEEANRLLFEGGYRNLTPEEAEGINPIWEDVITALVISGLQYIIRAGQREIERKLER